MGLLGANGAGKTTTLQILLGSLKPTSGQIFYFGKDFQKDRSASLEKISFASTYISLPWNLTVYQNLKVVATLYGIDTDVFEERVDTYLDRFGLVSKKHAMVGSLSAGQLSRLMLIKAFIVEPMIVLLDEPTAALDADIAKDVLHFLKEQREIHKTSILYTSHNMREIDEICDRVLFMESGEIIADNTPKNLARMVANCRVQILDPTPIDLFLKTLDSYKLLFEKENDCYTLHLPEEKVTEFIKTLMEKGVHLKALYIDPPSIEGYFMHRVKQTKQREAK